MYTFNENTGEVIRDVDGIVVSPCQTSDDPNFVEYMLWINQGNHPDIIPHEPQQIIPQEVTRFQARGALYLAGLLDQVEQFVSASDTDMMIKLAWQDAQTFKRTSAFITGIAKKMNLSDDQIDQLFLTASQIE
jgi:hypothetical protein